MAESGLHVLYVVSTLEQKGPTKQLFNIIQHLDSRFSPIVLTLSPEPALTMKPEFESMKIPVLSLLEPRWKTAVRRNWRKAVARRTGVNLDQSVIIHTQGIRADVIASRFLQPIARLATVRNYPYEDYVMKFGKLRGSAMARLHLGALRRLPAVVACGSSLARRLKAAGVEATVIRNGVDVRIFASHNGVTRGAARAKLGMDEGIVAGIVVGSLVARKDPVTIVKAVQQSSNRNLRLLFVGSGELEEMCRRVAASDSRIMFLGHRENVAEALHAADFFVSASHSEGLPNAALEAIAAGIPVLLSDIDPHREILDLFPFAGEAFTTGSAAALAALVDRVTRSRPTIDESRRRTACEGVGAARMSREYQEQYLRMQGRCVE